MARRAVARWQDARSRSERPSRRSGRTLALVTARGRAQKVHARALRRQAVPFVRAPSILAGRIQTRRFSRFDVCTTGVLDLAVAGRRTSSRANLVAVDSRTEEVQLDAGQPQHRICRAFSLFLESASL